MRAAAGARRGRFRGRVALLGPAFVAAVAYIEPGNFATNIAGGASYGYLLVWVIVAANLMAMLVQYLSAKTGIATGRNLPELCRDRFPRPVTWGLWVQAEAIAIATDLAEFVGAAIALNLLFGVPPFAAGLITAVVAFAILAPAGQGLPPLRAGHRGLPRHRLPRLPLRPLVHRRRRGRLAAGLIPGFEGTDSILLAVGILGATVMPHVVYLHSALTSARIPTESADEKRELLRFQRVDVSIAMGIAGVDQHDDAGRRGRALPRLRAHGRGHDRGRPRGHRGADRRRRGARLRGRAAGLRPVELERRHVRRPGRDAGLHRPPHQPLPAPRDHDAPALVVLAIGLDPSSTLVISQVVLSFGIPFALVPMILLTRRADVMGALVNRRCTTVVASVVAALIISLNVFLLYETFFG